MTLIRIDRPADTEQPAGHRHGAELLRLLLAGFSSRSYPPIGPVCFWLPYPPYPGSVKRSPP